MNGYRAFPWALLVVACGGQAREGAGGESSTGGDASAATGSATTGDGSGGTVDTTSGTGGGGVGGAAGGSGPVGVEDLRFELVRAGQDDYCGITRDDRRVVCVRDDEVTFELPGPVVSFDMSDETPGWNYRCAVLESGEIRCFGEVELAPPEGNFSSVSIGAFSACARGSEGFECWVPTEIGGAAPPEFVGSTYSVEMWSFCTQIDMWHASCLGLDSVELLPAEGHYLDVKAAPMAGCAALLTPTSQAAPSPPMTVAEVLERNCIACFDADGVRWKLDGLFTGIDVNVDEDGCAWGQAAGETANRVSCWGAFEGSLPADFDADVLQLSVSLSQVCLLNSEGRVSCFPAR